MISQNSPPQAPAPELRLFYPSPPLGSAHFDIVGLGCREWMGPGWIHRPQGTDDWLLMAFEAPMQIEVEGQIRTQAQPAMMIWCPGSVHRYGHLASCWRHSWMHVRGEGLPQLLRTSGLPVGLPIV
ncbi:MAG: hypothetical protein ACOCXJ_08035, partial [Planctomycetota bacterium]